MGWGRKKKHSQKKEMLEMYTKRILNAFQLCTQGTSCSEPEMAIAYSSATERIHCGIFDKCSWTSNRISKALTARYHAYGQASRC